MTIYWGVVVCTMYWLQYFRVAIFIAHAFTAVLLLLWTTGVIGPSLCGNQVTVAYYEVDAPDRDVDLASVLVNMDTVEYGCRRNVTSVFGLDSFGGGWGKCMSRQVHPVWDVPYDPISYVPGSSWNVPVMIMLFEWITASFALFYINPGDWSWTLFPGVNLVPVVCTVWNVILVVVIWSMRVAMQIPDNNLFLFSFCLFSAVVFQNYVARPRTKQDSLPEQKPLVEEGVAPQNKVVWRTDHFIRNRKQQNGRVRFMGADAKFGDDYHEAKYADVLDDSGEGPVVRYMEYLITAPLLLECLYLGMGSTGLVWTYQAVFASLSICNMMGIPLHYIVMALPSAVGEAKTRLQVAGWSSLISSWMAWAAGFFVFIYTARHYLLQSSDVTQLPSWVQALLWIILIFYSAFGVVVTRLYVPLLMGGELEGVMQSATLALDVLSPTVKLVVAWVVWTKGSLVACNVDSSNYVCR